MLGIVKRKRSGTVADGAIEAEGQDEDSSYD